MGQESIKVMFENIAGPFNHGTLVYTNAAGQVFFAGGDRSNNNMSSFDKNNPGNIILGDMVATGLAIGPSPYGNLITIQGSASDPALAAQVNTWLNPANSSTTLAAGSDLSSQWATISSAMTQIGSLGLAYGPSNQNSNSAWCTATNAAGIPVPASALFSEIGCGNILPTSFKVSSDSVTTTETVDGSGTKVVVVTDASAGNGQVAKEVVGFNSATTTSYDEEIATSAAGATTATLVGAGANITIGSNTNITVTSTQPLMMGFGTPHPGNPDTVSATGSGDTITLKGIGSTTVNGTGEQINVLEQSADPDAINGNDSIYLQNNSAVYFNDGATESVSGQGSVYGSYGSISLASNANVGEYGNNEQIFGGSTDNLVLWGSDDSFSGAGATITPQPGSSITVNGADTIDLNYSHLVVTASSSSFISNTNNLTNVTIFGNSDTFTGTGLHDSFTIGGTYDVSYLGYNTNSYLGVTTGDYNYGTGSTTTDTPNPDPYYPPEWDPYDSEDDPVILNLTGAVVQTQNLSTSSAYFDVQNIGSRQHTGWGTAGEGYLVYDPSNKNSVTNEQSLVPSFAALRALDLNKDGVLNSLDKAWSSLKVWTDAAGTGAFVAGSLQTVSQLGIASINLNSSHPNTIQNNNTILDDSTFTWNSGSVGHIDGVELHFHANTVVNYVAPPPPPRCVHVGSALPCGTIAGDVKVGATLQLADEVTLAARTGEVSFSKRVKALGVRITTQSGVSLVCSESAPIPTPEGLVLAPHLRGKKVPTRLDGPSGSRTAWEMVEVVESVGEIEVQHITVGDKCFWAGEQVGAYILHHNLKIQEP